MIPFFPNEKQGGPAFPIEIPAGNGSGPVTCYGMTLRDYFAGQVLAGAYAAVVKMSITGNSAQEKAKDICETFQGCVFTAYTIADLMLAERSKEKS